jgi:hypothetical protein
VLSAAVIHALLLDKSDYRSETLSAIATQLETLSGAGCEEGEGDCGEQEVEREILDELAELLELEPVEEALTLHENLSTTLSQSSPSSNHTGDRQRLLKPRRPARPKAVNRRWSWTDLEQ